jgi:3-oxoacyl-[acyl-carrier-protein] synthase II
MLPPERQILITGAGVVSPVGIGFDAFLDGLAAGRQAPLVPLSEWSAQDSPEAEERPPSDARGFAIPDFDPRALLPGVKGLRGMSRTAHLACASVALALDELSIPVEKYDPTGEGAPGARAAVGGDRIGLVGGTVYGNVESVGRFGLEVEVKGPRFVDAMLFPNTVLNSAAGFASIAFGLTALNSTVSAGPATGLSALAYASRLLKRRKADRILAGAYEELSPWIYRGFEAEGRLAQVEGPTAGRPLPFGQDRAGTALGEGAALLCLESGASVQARGGAEECTVIAGLAEAYAGGGDLTATYGQVIARALDAAELEPGDLGAAFTAASGERDFDALEARALREVLGDAISRVPLVPLKAILGETSGAHGALAVAAAHGAILGGRLPHLPDYALDPSLGRDRLTGPGGALEGGVLGELAPVLVACAGRSGSCAALVLRRARVIP